MKIACIIIPFVATFVSSSPVLNECTVKVEMETEYGTLTRSFKEWQIMDDLCPPFLLVTGGVSRFYFACSDGVASRVEMFTEDSFYDEMNAHTIIASDSWTHRIVGDGSPSVVFERSLDTKELNRFKFEIKTERSFTICGFNVYSQDTNIAFGMTATISHSNGTTRSAQSVTDGKNIDQNGGCYMLQRDSYLELDAAPKQFCAVQRILIQFQNLVAKAEHSLTVDGHNCQFKRQMDNTLEYECTSPNHGYDATAVKCGNSLQFKNLGRDVLNICEIQVYQNPAGFECGEPEFPANGGGVVSLKGESYFVDYTCNEGYHLVGDSRRTCHGRHWQGKQPVCIPEQFQSAAPRSSKSITKRITSDFTSVPLWTSTTTTKATEGGESAMLFIWIGLGLCLLLGLVAVVLLSVIYRIYWKRKKYVHDYESIGHGNS